MKKLLAGALMLTTFPGLSTLAEPLKLVSTSPTFWATNVNPVAQKTISLTFDQRLRGKLTDWIGLDVLSPPSDFQTTFSPDQMSCSIAVRLDPGKVYICALNGRGLPGVGFQTEKGLGLPPSFLVFQTAGTPKPEDAPPLVVRSMPANADQQVDPAKTKAIVLTFDRPMQTAKQGLHLFENNNPIDISKSRLGYSADGRTFTLYYDFKPSTPYRVALNNNNDIGFSSATRVPLWPVQLTFATAQPR
jgi:hypothetical protein